LPLSTYIALFTLGLAQIRHLLRNPYPSLCKLSPEITHTEEDISKVKREQNTVKGGWLTVAMNPNLRLGWTRRGITEGVEKTQRRWQIIPLQAMVPQVQKSTTRRSGNISITGMMEA